MQCRHQKLLYNHLSLFSVSLYLAKVYLIIGKLNIYDRLSVVRSLLAVRGVEHIFTDGLLRDEDIVFTGAVIEECRIGLTVHLLGGGEQRVGEPVLVVDLLHLGPVLHAGLLQLAATTDTEEREEKYQIQPGRGHSTDWTTVILSKLF